MLDFTYAGLLRRAGLTPPREALHAALEALRAAPRLEVDRAAPGWVGETVTVWAARHRVAVRDLVKVAGLPVPDEAPMLVSVPDRAGLVPPASWDPPAGSVVITHRFGRGGGLAAITVETGFDDPAWGPPLGDQLGKRLRQVRGARRLEGTAGPWCTFLQPAEPAAVLTAMEADGIRGGDPVALPEFAGGIAAIVPEGAADADLARYISVLAAALGRP